MSKLNKRAVAILSLCLILFVTIMPFAVLAEDRPSNLYYDYTYIWTGFTQFPSNYSESISVDFYLQRSQYNYHISSITYVYTYYGSTGRRWNWGLRFYDDNNNIRLELDFSYYGYQIGGQTNVDNLPIDFRVYGISFSSPLPSLNYYTFTEIHYISGYTLTFDSQGGTAIAPVTGTDITLGENGSYYSQYIPVRYGYDFVGWSLTPNGNIVYNVTLTEDTDIYAIWQAKANNVQIVAYQQYDWITYYADQSHSIPLPSLYEGDTGTIDIYYSLNQPQGYYFQGLHVDFNGQDYANLYVEDLTQHFTLGIPDVSGGGILEIYPLFEQRYDFNVTYNPSGNGTSNTFDLLYETSYVGGSQVHIVGSYEYPTFFTNCRIVGTETSKIYPVSVHDEYNETLEQFDVEFNFTMPNEVCTLQIYWSILGGYPPQPTVSFDESTGDIYFIGVDYDNMYSEADFSGASDLIPKDIIGFAEYFSSLNGLVIIVTIILIAGFSAFLLRNH